MNIQRGSVVRATAGRDKDGFFVVRGTDGEFAFIANGKRRKVQSPKRKNLKHLAPTGAVYQGSLETNPQVKKVLREFNGG